MIEIVWQYDPSLQEGDPSPASAIEARRLLESGNRDFADLLANINEEQNARRVLKIFPGDLEPSETGGMALRQTPFAAILSCADARVPTELVFAQAANDLFTVRVAGNVLASACLGSLDYAVENLESVQLLVVLGHTGCGAVTAAVDSMQKHTNYINIAVNQPLRVIIDSLIAVVNSAEYTLNNIYGPKVTQSPGYRSALIELAVSMNAVLIAGIIQKTYAHLMTNKLEVVYGIYNLRNRLVGRPAGGSAPDYWEAGLFNPPQEDDGFVLLGNQFAESEFINQLLASKVA
jgi:carbonic anhydrase